MWNLKHDTNELVCETETDAQRTDAWLPRREVGGMDRSVGLAAVNCEIQNEQGPTVEHRELYSTSYDKSQWKIT